MRTIDIVLETLAHFVKMEGGPPPGIPVRVESDFERKLVRLCEWHSLAPLFLDSLQKLALESPISDVTLERLNALARTSAGRNEKYIAALRSISARLRERRVPFLLVDDMMAALKLYPRHRLRPIERLDVLIHEADWEMFVSALRAIGYRREERDPTFEDGREAMLYHQYFTPCVLQGEREVSIGVKFRVIDVGHPARSEAAWALGKRLGRDIEAMRLSYEDQYVRSCMAYNMTGFGRLLNAVDAGRILARHGEDLDWGYIEGLARDGSFYPALYLTHETIVKMFEFPATRKPLPNPARVKKSFFQMVWRPGHVGALTERPPTLHRYRFSLCAHGSWSDRLKVVANVAAPRKEWVAGYFGRSWNPWLGFKFVSLALRNRLSEPPAPGEPGRPEAKAGREGAPAEARPLRSGQSREGYPRDTRAPRDGQRRDPRSRRDYGPRDGRSRRGGAPPRRPRPSPDERPPETRPTREDAARLRRPDRGERRSSDRSGRRESRPENGPPREAGAQEPRPSRGRSRRRWSSGSRRSSGEDRGGRPDERRDRPDERAVQGDERRDRPDERAVQGDERRDRPDERAARGDERRDRPDERAARGDERRDRPDERAAQGDERPRQSDSRDSSRDDRGVTSSDPGRSDDQR
jgi:hypothetical protein